MTVCQPGECTVRFVGVAGTDHAQRAANRIPHRPLVNAVNISGSAAVVHVLQGHLRAGGDVQVQDVRGALYLIVILPHYLNPVVHRQGLGNFQVRGVAEFRRDIPLPIGGVIGTRAYAELPRSGIILPHSGLGPCTVTCAQGIRGIQD